MKRLIMVLFCAASTVLAQDPLALNRVTPIQASAEEVQELKAKSREKATEFLANRIIVKDSEIQVYLQGIVHRLVQNSPAGFFRTEYTVSVVWERGIRAGSFFNGDIVFDFTFLKSLKSEDVIALVLAHEIVHVARLHTVQYERLQKMQNKHFESLAKNRANSKLVKQLLADQKRQRQDFVFLCEAEADLLAARLLVLSGYLITEPEHIRETFAGKEQGDYTDADTRTKAIMGEMATWNELCVSCKAISHPVPEWFKKKCEKIT